MPERHTQQFVFSGPEDTDISDIESTVRDALGDAVERMHQSTRLVDVPPDKMERGPSKQIDVLIATVYLDKYYLNKSTPSEYVGDDATDLKTVFSDHEIGVSSVANSAF